MTARGLRNNNPGFNPRTYIRYDFPVFRPFPALVSFNPRTYIRYDVVPYANVMMDNSFNPRTYIRYDDADFFGCPVFQVSIHVPI